MDEQGIHAAIIFPNLASVIERHLGHRPNVVSALFSSLNKWVAEEYGFTNGRQFPVAAICLSDPDWAVREPETVIKEGARASTRVRGLAEHLKRAYAQLPKSFKRDPLDTLAEHLYVMPFHEESISDLSQHGPIDRILFGSDWPYSEGLRNPLDFFDIVEGLFGADKRKIMCDHMKSLVEGRY